MNIATRFTRILVAGLWSLLAMAMLKWFGVEFPEGQAVAIQESMTIVLTAVISALIGLAAKKWPNLEWLLGVGRAPLYKVEQNDAV